MGSNPDPTFSLAQEMTMSDRAKVFMVFAKIDFIFSPQKIVK
jgi:hypothetical protein